VFRILTLVWSLAVGLAASQLPEFAQQYRQRLAGAVDELTRIVDGFDADARAEGLDRSEALKRFGLMPDSFVQRRGRSMSDTIARLDRLKAQQAELDDPVPWRRLVPVVAQMDGDVACRTLADFEPAVPVTAEGLGLGALGLFLGSLVAPLFGLSRRRTRRA